VQSCVTTAGPEVSDVITKQRPTITSAANITANIGPKLYKNVANP